MGQVEGMIQWLKVLQIMNQLLKPVDPSSSYGRPPSSSWHLRNCGIAVLRYGEDSLPSQSAKEKKSMIHLYQKRRSSPSIRTFPHRFARAIRRICIDSWFDRLGFCFPKWEATIATSRAANPPLQPPYLCNLSYGLGVKPLGLVD